MTLQFPKEQINYYYIAIFFAICTFSSYAYGQDLQEGKALFNSKCTACHAIDRDMVGPRLAGISQKRDEAWLLKWIRNSPAMIAEGDEQAVTLFEGHDKVMMTPFPDLSNDNIRNILAYIEQETAAAKPTAVTPGTAQSQQSQTAPFLNWMTGIFALVLLFALFAILALGKVIKILEKHLLSSDYKLKATKREDLPSPINKEEHLHG
ncbi:cytochrome c [Olivibacter sitiensis]|uniref:cytochrome c n=1 Tax=Olivibacter sitiensis TaxID=376470 RepID=UPI000401FF92|nr:cytochrome c [Olivibacter sitiensis]